jgi:hypothetical protein
MRKYLRVDEDLELEDDLSDSAIAADGTVPQPQPFERPEAAGLAIVRNRLT